MSKKTNSNTANNKGKGGGQSKKAGSTTLNVKMKKGVPPNSKSKAKVKTAVSVLSKSKSKPITLNAKSKTTSTSLGPTTTNKRKKQQQPQKTPATTPNNTKSMPSNSTKISLFSKPAIVSSISKSTSKTNIKTNVNSAVQKQDNSSLAGAHPKPASDKSLLNVPHEVRIHGFSSLLQTMEKATPKVKQLLLNECDLIMECRSCRNLFRSYPNFINHKLNYCKSIFHPATENGCSQFIDTNTNNSPEIQYYIASSSRENEKISTDQGRHENEDISDRFQDTKMDSGSVSALYKNIQELNEQKDERVSETMKLALQPVSGRNDSIMLQSKIETDQSVCDSSNVILDSRDTAMLGPDGKVICTATGRGMEQIVRHLSAQIFLAQQKMVQQSTNQLCDICKTVFSSETALRQHRRDAPDCAIKQSSFRSSTSGLNTASTMNGSKNPSPLLESTLNKSRVEENRQFVKQLFSRTSPHSQLQRFIPTTLSTSTASVNLNSKFSPYKKTVGKAVKNLHTSSTLSSNQTFALPLTGKGPTDLKFPCTKCSTICQSFQQLAYHRATQCSNDADNPPAKTQRIGIEARTCYAKPLNSELTRQQTPGRREVSIFSKSFENTVDETIEEKKHHVNKTTVDVNCNVSSAGETMQCGDDEQPDTKYSPTVVPIATSAGLTNGDSIGQDNLQYDVFSNNPLQSSLPNGLPSSLTHNVDQDEENEDQDRVSNLTDSGVSSGSCAVASDDRTDGRISANGKSSPSMDSTINTRKSKVSEDLAPKNNKNLKPSPVGLDGQTSKRVSARNLLKPKPINTSGTLGKPNTGHSSILNRKK